ncbi:MAG TPA: O-antigen ligase family protein [bacterium]|nr:O-antigen ligase family protein [bacterium]
MRFSTINLSKILQRVRKYSWAFLLEKTLFYLVLFSIPLNLGKHFVVETSYIYGKLVDYVIPTVYIQDILVFLLVLVTFPKLIKSFIKHISHWEFAFLILFFAGTALSVCSSQVPISANVGFSRLFLYSAFGFYVFSQINLLTEMPRLLRIFTFLLFFQSVLGLAQWFNQGSIFNNYLFLGEQPYSMSTPNIVRTSWKGFSRVPSYGTFRHPNVLASFLVLNVLFILGMRPKHPFYYCVVFLSIVSLYFTFSVISLYGLIFGISAFLIPKKNLGSFLFFIFWLGVFATLFLVFAPSLYLPLNLQNLIISFFANPSVFRRRNLILVALKIFGASPLFGVGLNNSLYYVDKFSVALSLPKFTQPIHNIYLLLLSEVGIINFFFLATFFLLLFKKLYNSFLSTASGKYSRLFLVQLTILLFFGFFDHYLITAQQIYLFSCLTVGLALQYNLR